MPYIEERGKFFQLGFCDDISRMVKLFVYLQACTHDSSFDEKCVESAAIRPSAQPDRGKEWPLIAGAVGLFYKLSC